MENIFTPFIKVFSEVFLLLIDVRLSFFLLIGVVGGIIVGALPGLTATMAIGLLAGITYGIDPQIALLSLMGVYVGGVYGACQTAILINVPGTPVAAATALDGFPLCQRGEAGPAIGLATIASFIGTLFGMICLLFITPFLTSIALKFGSWEFFWLGILGVIVCGNVTAKESAWKGWLAGFLGLLLSMTGMETIWAYRRFTFGYLELSGGISLVPALIGLFGLPEVVTVMGQISVPKVSSIVTNLLPSLNTLKKYSKVYLSSGILGVLIGIIPGVGEDIAAWVGYDYAKRTSKNKELFGKGSYEGVVAAEVANNACIGGAIIPVLSLAIPGSAASAVLLAALWMHGIRPGPMIQFEFPNFIYEMAAILLVASFFMLLAGLVISKLMVHIVKVPREILFSTVVVLSVIGSYAISGRLFDVYIMFFFGILGSLFRALDYPAAPTTLAIILGPMIDENLRRGLIRYHGNVMPFFTRPISLILVIVILLMILSKTKLLYFLFKKIKR